MAWLVRIRRARTRFKERQEEYQPGFRAERRVMAGWLRGVIIEVILVFLDRKSIYILHLVLVGCPIPQEARPEAITMGVVKAYDQ